MSNPKAPIMVRGADLSASFSYNLIKTARKRGVSDEEFYAGLSAENDNALYGKIVDYMQGKVPSHPIVDALCAEAGKQGLSTDEVTTYLTPTLMTRFVGLLAAARNLAKNIYRLVVDKVSSIEKLVKDGNYDYANPDINSKNFPDIGSDETGEAYVIPYDREMASEEVLADLDSRGLRAGNVRELLSFGKTYPETQREFPVIALGQVASLDGGRFVAFLGGLGARRVLYLFWFGSRWIRRCRFLAFRKQR